ncbi:MAG: hypothetical protein K6G25_03635 [Bacteroidales bacterium]|nr:hypothetical protein [Bacteroidales bacterium]
MDEKFTREEQTAIASVLYNLVGADFQTHEGENECLKDCLATMDFEAKDFKPIPKNELQMKAFETLKKMSKEKKHIFSRMMTQISRADGHFGFSEQTFVKEILVMCDIPFVHK